MYMAALFYFFAITFLLPLISLLLRELIDNHSVKFILYGVEAASPTIAVIMILCVTNRTGDFLTRNFNKSHLVMAVILPAFIAFLTMLLVKVIPVSHVIIGLCLVILRYLNL